MFHSAEARTAEGININIKIRIRLGLIRLGVGMRLIEITYSFRCKRFFVLLLVSWLVACNFRNR